MREKVQTSVLLLCNIGMFSRRKPLVHLFWTCPFADKYWDFICPPRTKNLPVYEPFSDIKHKLQVPFYMATTILAAWGIWIIRNNNKIFKNQTSQVGRQFIFRH
jgi:hypothetical protein